MLAPPVHGAVCCASAYRIINGMIAIIPRPRSGIQAGAGGSGPAAFSVRRGRFRRWFEFFDMELGFPGPQGGDQNIQAFGAALIGYPVGQAAVVLNLPVDLLAFPAHVDQPIGVDHVPR